MCYCVILPQPLILVLQLLDFLRHAVLLCLSSLGLAAPPAADDHPAYAPPPARWAVAACIDKWGDKGQATCPLCRALLLPTDANAGKLPTFSF